MVVWSLDIKKDPYHPIEENEKVLGFKIPYLSVIGALMCFAQCTRPDIGFSVNLLARYNSAPTQRHWIDIKHVLRHLRGTTDLGIFYFYDSRDSNFVGYIDSGYLSNPHNSQSQTCYVFLNGNAAIS